MTMKPCDFCEGYTPDDRGKEFNSAVERWLGELE